MLVLSRKAGQSIFVGDDIVLKILNVAYHQVQIGIEAPESVCILRDDVKKKTRDLIDHVHPAVLARNSGKNTL